MKAYRFFRQVYSDNGIRKQVRRNLRGDVLLYAKNRLLMPLERLRVHQHYNEAHPICFIVAPPRSGTTLLFQLIARYLDVAYPSNFVSRYWMAPVCGMQRLERMNREQRDPIPLHSLLGGTGGANSPHEFGWFWQFWGGLFESDDLLPQQLDCIDWHNIRRELYGMAGYADKPLVLKSLNYVVYNIPRLAKELPSSKFIYIHRDPRYVVQSILECRQERYGSESVWWGVRPRDVADWSARPALDQVCHQVSDITCKIENDLMQAPHRSLQLSYEDLVRDPHANLKTIAEFLGCRVSDALLDLRHSELPNGNTQRMPNQRFHGIAERIQQCE